MSVTYIGYIESQSDVLLLLEALLRGILKPTAKRLTFKERQEVKSGHVYIYDEQQTGICRWTDGKKWSPSRILGSFLIYKEIGDSSMLLKKTINVSYNQTVYHLVAYYNENDLSFNRLERPSEVLDLKMLDIRNGFTIAAIGNKKCKDGDEEKSNVGNEPNDFNRNQRNLSFPATQNPPSTMNPPCCNFQNIQFTPLQPNLYLMPSIYEPSPFAQEVDSKDNIAKYLHDAIDELTKSL